jgi:hypothetical protein
MKLALVFSFFLAVACTAHQNLRARGSASTLDAPQGENIEPRFAETTYVCMVLAPLGANNTFQC